MNYLVRVQLDTHAGLAPGSDAYDKLHEAMEKAGASRTIIGCDTGRPIAYQLPHAEYRFKDSGTDAEELRDMVKTIADPIWPSSEILVAHFRQCAWSLNRAA